MKKNIIYDTKPCVFLHFYIQYKNKRKQIISYEDIHKEKFSS